MKMRSRIILSLVAASVGFGVALAPTAYAADDMKKMDKKDTSMSKDKKAMDKNDGMKKKDDKDSMMKKDKKM